MQVGLKNSLKSGFLRRSSLNCLNRSFQLWPSCTPWPPVIRFRAHLPAVAVHPENRCRGIVRAARESRTLPQGRVRSRTGWSRYKRTGDFLMAINDGSQAKAAVSSPSAHGAPVGIVARRERSRGHGSNEGAEIKIIQFPVNIDKFTGFFDKFLKSVFLVTGCNQKSFFLNLSVAHSNIAAKKVFRIHRIFRNCPHLRTRTRRQKRHSRAVIRTFAPHDRIASKRCIIPPPHRPPGADRFLFIFSNPGDSHGAQTSE